MELLAIPCKSIHPSFAAHNSPNSWVFSSSYIFFSLPPPLTVTGDPNEIAEQEKASSATTRRGSSLGRGAGEHGCPGTLRRLPKNQHQWLPVPSPPNASHKAASALAPRTLGGCQQTPSPPPSPRCSVQRGDPSGVEELAVPC